MKAFAKTVVTLQIIFISCCDVCYSQNETNIWCFGRYTMMDFSSGEPVLTYSTPMYAFEGTSTVSDSCGNLLFYTDGQSVWNRNHIKMQNGTWLLGGTSSTQAALTIKKPGSQDHYYIFTTAHECGTDGFRYTEVDMTLSSGYGDVVPGMKNILLQSLSGEKISAAKHANGIDVWVTTHDMDNNTFRTYLVSGAGVNPNAIISNVGLTHNFGPQCSGAVGELKFSPNGEYIVTTDRNTFIQLFQFDNSSGTVYNPITINDATFSYSFEFSSNSKVLYADMDTFNLYQFDVSVFDSVAIAQSKTQLTTTYKYARLQLAKNGKIYVERGNGTDIGAIHHPNQVGIACLFNPQELSDPHGTTQFSFPDFPPYYFKDVTNNITSISLPADTAFCEGNSINITAAPGFPYYHWFLNGNPFSNSSAVTIDSSGNYTLEVSDNIGCPLIDDFNVVVNPMPELQTVNDTTLCEGNTLTLATSGAVTYEWSPPTYLSSTSIASPVAAPLLPVTYTVTGTGANGCVASQQVDIDLTTPPQADFIYDFTYDCNGPLLHTENNSVNATHYIWNFGDGNFSHAENPLHHYNDHSGHTVILIAYNEGCSDTAVALDIKNSSFMKSIPDIFTPNGDGKNDCFELPGISSFAGCYNLEIFNRWGNKVYSSADVTRCWNGSGNDGEPLPSGTYFYVLDLSGSPFQGTVSVLREKK